jgi:hypothetical protein
MPRNDIRSKQIYTLGPDGDLAHADRVYIQNAGDVAGEKAAFGGTQTTELHPVVALKFPYHINSGLIVTSGVSGGTLSQASGMAVLTTDETGSSFIAMESRRVIRYAPGQGGRGSFGAVMDLSTSGQKSLIGIGDESDGFFFGCSGDVLGIWHRNFGAEDFIPQSDWSQDRFDGTQIAPSAIISNGNIYQIEYRWLGFGQITFSIEDKNTGGFRECHRIKYTNTHQVPSTDSPSFPLRVELDNNGDGAAQTIKTFSMAGFIKGRADGPSLLFGASGSTILNGSNEVNNVLTIRNKDVFQGEVNRTPIVLRQLSAGADGGNEIIVELATDTPTSGGAWVDVNTNRSVVEINTTAVPSGEIQNINGGTMVGRNSAGTLNVTDDNIIVLPGETLSVIARRTGGTINVFGFLTWKELY